MGGGNRPWLGVPVKVKVKSIGNGKAVLEYDKSDPPDIEEGYEYVVVFHKPAAGGGSGPAAKSAG